MEYGVLKELNVKPGDVVEWCGIELVAFEQPKPDHAGDVWAGTESSGWLDRNAIVRIVSRASNTPPTWDKMTDEERRDISFDAMSGKEIELGGDFGWQPWDHTTPLCETHQPIRIKPEPVHETMTMMMLHLRGDRLLFVSADMSDPTHHITFDLIDGEPDCSSIRMEKLK